VEAEAQRIARPASASDANPIARYFRFAERGTNFTTEIKAGVTTFMVMVYIVAVNPLILSNAGIDIGAAAAATALVAGVMTILMGVVANFPIAIAAGLGINGVVAFGLVLAQGLTPAGAMGVIVMEGLAITLLVIVGLREAVMNAVPLSLKRAIAVGIGLFILFIGFVDAGLIRQPAGDGPVPVEFVFPNTTTAWVALIGLLITIVLFVRRVPAALLLGVTQAPETFSVLPNFSTLGAFDFSNVFVQLGLLAALLTIFTIMLADFFDTMGTGTAIAEQAGLVTPDGKLPGVGRLLLVDSVAAAAGGAAGISSNTSYIESAAGVAEGGRTGFTAVVVGVLFLLAIFVSPLVELVPFAATAPVLIVVGYLMALFIRDIDFRDVEEGFPALLALILMPLTFNITIGIGAGFVAWVVIKLVRGKVAQIHPLMWVVSIAFAVYFAQAWINAVLPASA